MKKLIIISIFMCGSILQAQVQDSIIYKQLYLSGYRAQRMAGTGATLAVTGTFFMVTGILIDRDYDGEDKPLAGSIISEAGLCMFAVGIPLWMIQLDKMNRIEVELIKYGGITSGPGIGVAIKF